MAQPFLHAGENGGVVARLDMDHATGRQAGLFQPRGEQVGLRHAPEHLPGQARRDPGGKTGRRRAIDGAVSAARNFVQAAKRQPAPGQASVKFGQAERQRRLRRAVVALDRCDPVPQRHESRIGSGRGHGSVGLLSEGDSGLYVHHSFHKPRMSIRRMAFVILAWLCQHGAKIPVKEVAPSATCIN